MKKFLLFIILLSASFASYADRVRSSVAENVAKTMLPKAELKELSHQTNFSNFYIFSSDNGFVIVSADDRAFPVIAYSDKNPFKVKDMSENVYSWLKSVDKGIQNIADSKVVASEAVKAEWKSFAKGKKPAEKYRSTVEPLLTTTWGQDYPYNDSCPIPWGGEDRTVVGCVATAMAQIMNYWEWPHRGVGEKSYSPSRPIGILTANFGETVYDWDNMVDEFWIYKAEDSTWTYESWWSEEEVDAVATLMFHCGVSVRMDYGVDESGAYSEDVAPALKNYFDYDPNLQHVYKSNYTDTEWKDLLKSELNAGRPVYYAGNTAGLMGHAFVCDGYDANGYFHFNWGWDGYCDGYYLIGDLEPGIGGTGAGNGSYNDNNNIIIGIQPNPAHPRISAPTNLTAEVDFPNVTITWSEVAEAVSYKLYRNGKLVARVTDNYYTDLAPGQHTYYVRSVDADGVNSFNSETLDVEVLYPGPKITDLTAKRYNVNNVKLNWTSDVVEKDTLKYYDGDYQGWITSVSPTFYWGHRFAKEELTAKYAGMSITSVDVMVLKDEQYELAIFTEEDNVLEKVYSQEFTCPSGFYEKWFTITLDTPILLDYTKNILIMLRCPSGNESGVQIPVAVDESVNFDKNARVMYDGVYFYEMADTDTWFIRTHIVSANTYDVYRNGEEIASEIAETSYNDTNLEFGTYEYSVRANYSGGVTEPKTVVIELGEPEEYTLTLSVDSEEKGSVEGGGKYLESTIVTAKATPKYGYELKEWTENGTQVSTDASYTFEIEANRDLVANFVENNLSIEVVGITRPTYMGASDGKIEVKAKSGTAPYIYELGSDKSEPINTSYTFENLAAGDYTVKVTDATGFSVTEIVVLDGSGELSPPTNVKAVANGTTITLSWDPVVGAEAYFIYSGWETVGAAFSKTKFELKNLTPEETYCYTVVALAEFDDEGYPTKYSDFSEEACATTGDGPGDGEVTEVLPPSNVKAVATSSTTIRLSWDAVDGALAYGVFYEGEYLGVVYENFAEFEELVPNYTYCFTVMTIAGVDSEGYITEYSDESEEACVTTESDGGEVTEIPVPTNVKAVATSSTTIRLSWDAVDGALAYGVFYEGEYLGVVYENFAEFEELEPNYTYCFTVMTITGVDSEGYITEYSDESEEACATPTSDDGVEELTSLFDIYPNPVEDKLFLATEIEIEEVTIYDIYGRQSVVYSLQTTDFVHSLDVADLEAGVCLMKIVTNQGEVVKRFVKR